MDESNFLPASRGRGCHSLCPTLLESRASSLLRGQGHAFTRLRFACATAPSCLALPFDHLTFHASPTHLTTLPLFLALPASHAHTHTLPTPPPPPSYNEVSFYALNVIHPVTHALGNTLKRVVMIIVSVLVLNHKFTPLGLAGCTTAIGGVMAYSIAKAKLESSGVVVPVGKLAEARAAAAAKEEQEKGAAAVAVAVEGKGEQEKEQEKKEVGDAAAGKEA